MIRFLKRKIKEFVEWKKITEIQALRNSNLCCRSTVRGDLPILFISLPGDHQRKQSIRQQCEVNRIRNFQIFDAIDGRKISPSFWEESKLLYDGNYVFEDCRERDSSINHKKLSAPEIGCALSHIHAYQKIYHLGVPAAVVMEDDALVDDWNFQEIVETLPRGWDICYLYYESQCLDMSSPSIKMKEKFSIYPFKAEVFPAISYIVSENGVKKLLHNAFPLRYPADGLLGRLVDWRILNGYGLYPRIVRKGQFSSTIR